MNVTLASAFRNSASRNHLTRYFRRVRQLERLLHAPLTWIAAEGDSIDQTHLALGEEARATLAMGRRSIVLDVSHGEREYGSTEEPERLAALSKLFNRVLDNIPKTTDVFLWVESDLLWDPLVLLGLAKHVWDAVDVGVIAPLTFAGEAHYDTFATRLLGPGDRRLPPFAPYFPDDYLKKHADPTKCLVEVASVGSCFAARGKVARAARITNDYAVVGWCENVRRAGGRIYLDTCSRVDHPHAGSTMEELR